MQHVISCERLRLLCGLLFFYILYYNIMRVFILFVYDMQLNVNPISKLENKIINTCVNLFYVRIEIDNFLYSN